MRQEYKDRAIATCPGHIGEQYWLQNSLLGWMRLCQVCIAADFIGLLLLQLPSQLWIPPKNTLCANFCLSICRCWRMQPETGGRGRLQEEGDILAKKERREEAV